MSAAPCISQCVLQLRVQTGLHWLELKLIESSLFITCMKSDGHCVAKLRVCFFNGGARIGQSGAAVTLALERCLVQISNGAPAILRFLVNFLRSRTSMQRYTPIRTRKLSYEPFGIHFPSVILSLRRARESAKNEILYSLASTCLGLHKNSGER
jgi:hypothetical protein